MQLLPVRAVAAILKVDVSTVYGLIKSRRLVAVNVGTGRRPAWRISDEAVETFIRGSTTCPLPPIDRRRRPRKDPHIIEFIK